ncbi:MAG: caspase family protein [Prevotella sp.]|nr:caspase family protein [Prevotella sp.]
MKKTFIALLAVALALPVTSNAQRKRAFMVGISTYDSSVTGWDEIHGAEDVYLLRPELENQGFQVTALVNEEATHDNILAAMDQFAKDSKKGDVVYLHFSCHGQPVEDGLNGNQLDEADGWDEALIPIDAGSQYRAGVYVGDKHILDDDLNVFFEGLRSKVGSTGAVYVAFDACHSGTMSRDLDFATVRGTSDGFTASGKRFRPPFEDTKHYQITSSVEQAPILFLEACRARERNTELLIDGVEYGSVTYNVLQAIKKNPLGRNGKQFEEDYIWSTQQPGHWNDTQHMVIESSF